MTKIKNLPNKGDTSCFITGNDVLITNNIHHLNQTVTEALEDVDDTLDEHKKDIDRLKSNVKYLYSYGGVGGNGRGGSGSNTGTPTLYISLNGRQIKSGPDNVIILNEPGNYVLEGKVSNNGGETFYVSVGYGNNINRPIEYILNAENKWKISPTTLKLNNNGEIVIQLSDSEGPLSEISQTYIVSPHTFTSKFMYEYDNGSGEIQYNEFSPYEYFIGSTSQTNPYIDISFKIDLLNVTNVEVKYDISETDGTENITYDEIVSGTHITNGHGIVSFGTNTNITTNSLKIYLDDLTKGGEKFTDESNNGTYTVSGTFIYTVNGNEQKQDFGFNITLIPSSLYIHVRNSQGIMYESLEEIKDACSHGQGGVPAKYINIGTYTSFYCKVFEGPMVNDAEHYYLNFNIYDHEVVEGEDTFNLRDTLNNSNVVEQVETNPPFSIAFQSKGIKKLEFHTTGWKSDNAETSTVKYIYVNEPEYEIKGWYPTSTSERPFEQSNYYFRANRETNMESDYLSGLLPLETSEKNRPITISGNWTESDSSKATTIISFGIQYSAVNTNGAKILEVFGSSQTPIITLYSNKLFNITSSTTDDDGIKKICIPSETNFNKSINTQYHLVQIVRHCIDEKNNAKQYASYLYIDGKLESSKSGVDTNPWRVNKIVFNNVNAVYNLIDIQYVKLLPVISQMTSSNRLSMYTIDELIYQYYLAYKDIMGAGTVTPAEKTIFDNMSSIKFDGTNVIVDYNFVKTVSTDMPIPTMMMEYVPSQGEDSTSIIKDLFRGYGTASNDFGQKTILLHWANGSGSALEESPISVPEIQDGVYTYTGSWKVELQGTSTMRNRIKNFSLILESTSLNGGEKQILMSPNYDPDDSSTFLPEQIWTLKADIADSAHANNTAVGKFVNSVCTKFSTSMGLTFDDDIKPYIKNTLEGFPILMYFKVGDTVYYLGVYNFNMGRNSYVNLGYYTNDVVRPMKDMIQASQTQPNCPFRYSVGSGVIPETLAVGEIQDNHAEFDFHQYDDTVLFGGPGTMFGENSKITGAGTDKSAAKTTLKNFVRSVARAGACCFACIGKEPIPSKKDIRFGDDETSLDCIKRYSYKKLFNDQGDPYFEEYVPDISWQFSIENGVNKWYDPTDTEHWPADREPALTFDALGADYDNLLQCIDDADKDRIPNPYYHFLDFTSVSEYYTICMAFGLVDSVLKNMNIKSWDGKKCCVAFYDMDCAMGENNTGAEDVTYLAASDYWYSPINNGYVEPVDIHYDYWNESIGKGFDYPSSYLFAIAKYAQSIVSRLGITLTRYPQQFWAELRKPDIGENQKGGELKSADYFINTYFSSGIGKIPAYLASMNYQVKYLYYGKITDENGNESAESTYLANGDAFNGSRLEKVKEWLNKRIHFLDFMFNLQKITVSVGGGYTMPFANDDTLALVKQNSDVVILTDAFTDEFQNGARVPSDSQPVNVYAPMNTPFIINRGSKNQMFLLCAGNTVANPIRINVTRSEPVRFYGSKEFTDLNMIEPFLTTANIISTNNLENIRYGGMDVPTNTSGLKIVSTSVKNVLLNIPTLSGKLEIASNDLNGQALTSLDISDTGLIGEWSNLSNLKILNISSVKNTEGRIEVSGCPIIGDDCTISGKNSEKLTTLKSLTLSGVEGNFNIRNTSIEIINITVTTNKEATFEINGDTRLNELRLTGFKSVIIRGCPNIEKLYILDHSDSSYKCETIIIDIPEYTNPNGNSQTLLTKFNSDTPFRTETIGGKEVTHGIFDFSGYTALTKLGFSGCKTAEVIKIPNRTVDIVTFNNNINLEFVDTIGPDSCIKLINNGTFYRCPKYGMYQSWSTRGDNYENGQDITTLTERVYACNKRTKMCIGEDNISLSNTFNKVETMSTTYPQSNPYTNVWGQKVYNQPINNASACWFIQDVVGGQPLDEAYLNGNIIVDSTTKKVYGIDRRSDIESLQACFNKQTGIIYNKTTTGTTPPNLSTYTSLTNIAYMYYGTGVKFLSKELLSLPYELNNNDSDTLTWGEFISSGDLEIAKDAFKNISYRITDLSNMQLTIYDAIPSGRQINYSQILETSQENMFDISDILCPGEDDFERLTSINMFSVNSEQWIDYRHLFNMCPRLSNIAGFLNNVDLTRSKIDGLLKNCTHLVSVSDSFNNIGGPNTVEALPYEIDLYEFFNWKDGDTYPLAAGMLKLFESSSTDKSVGFSVRKRISCENFKTILESLHNYTSLTKLTNIFSYCTIYNYDGSEIKLTGFDNDEYMDKIKSIDSLFYRCKSSDGSPLCIRRSFFEKLKKVTSLMNTFTDVYFDSMLSYDFFCKRIPKYEQIYIEIDNVIPQSPNAVLNTIGYSEDLITNMYNCFAGAKFKNCISWFDPTNINNTGLIPDDETITYNNEPYLGDTYYRREGGLPIEYHTKRQSIYSDTFNNFTNYISETRIIYNVSGEDNGTTLNNHDIEKDLRLYNNDEYGSPFVTNWSEHDTIKVYPTYCCLPPDIFHGCSINCNLTNVFSNTNIIGVLPQHLLDKCYRGKYENMFENVNILPNLIYHYDSRYDNTGNETIKSQYLNLISGIPVDESGVIGQYTLIGDVPTDLDSSSAVVLFRDANGELKRRRPIDNETLSETDKATGDYNKSQFVYIPQGYTTNSDLKYAFTFRYNLPAQINLYSQSLAQEGITWAAGSYGTECSPEVSPWLWPYYTQYFFMVDESIRWANVYDMSYSFISNSQDIDYETGMTRALMPHSEDEAKYSWWKDIMDNNKISWDLKTNGILNIFLNLCGQRSAATGNVKDYGCVISTPLNRNNSPQVGSFISGSLVCFLNGKVFDTGTDASRFTSMNASTSIIQYMFSRNLVLPQLNTIINDDPSTAPKVIINFMNDIALFYGHMFPTTQSKDNYVRLYNIPAAIISSDAKYKVL